MRFGAPHFPHVASILVLPCLITMTFFSMVSRIRRSASSRIDCFDICPHLPMKTEQAYSTDIRSCDRAVAKERHLQPHHFSVFGFDFLFERRLQRAVALRSVPRDTAITLPMLALR